MNSSATLTRCLGTEADECQSCARLLGPDERTLRNGESIVVIAPPADWPCASRVAILLADPKFTAAELRRKRQALDDRLRRFIGAEVAAFEQATGLSVDAVNVVILRDRLVGEAHSRAVVSEVCTEVRL